jgi:hypothetical protein
MPELIEIHDPGDIVYTLPQTGPRRGALRAWQVQDDGAVIEVHPVTKTPGQSLMSAGQAEPVSDQREGEERPRWKPQADPTRYDRRAT